MQRVADLRTTLSEWQVFLEPHMSNLAAASPIDLALGFGLAQTVSAQADGVGEVFRTRGLPDLARNIAAANARFSKALAGMATLVSGRPGAAVTAAVTAERSSFDEMWGVTSTGTTKLRQLRDRDLRKSTGHLDNSLATVVAGTAIAVVLSGGVIVVIGLRVRRRERFDRARTRRDAFESTLQNALEMSEVESEVYEVVSKALREPVSHLQVQLLVAESNRARFHQMLATGSQTEGENGCGVVSPLACPATIRGRTLVFPSSRAVDACPRLVGRPSGNCSAACVPVSIAGQTIGVLHATGPDDAPPTDTNSRYLEITARRMSERITMLRAFERSEAQARRDPLTGLWNRRSLEDRVEELKREGVPYTLAYGDLDHFKALNDSYGHETGDQALRLFSRVLRDSIRPDDIAARYGGEEFVIVLPDCSIETATNVLERIREGLALSLAGGRVPAFTVSFGLASSANADTYGDVLSDADRALFAAKAAGRNRVVVQSNATPEQLTVPTELDDHVPTT